MFGRLVELIGAVGYVGYSVDPWLDLAWYKPVRVCGLLRYLTGYKPIMSALIPKGLAEYIYFTYFIVKANEITLDIC